MSRTLYNEGRVVGLSAYEIFVRHVLGKDPNATVPSELAWLTSVMSNGSALLLQIGSDTTSGSGNVDGAHYIDITLPTGSGLWATNTIVGSCFIGTGGGVTTDHTGWCTKVVDYGPLIQNDSTASPTDATGTPPNTSATDIPPTTATGVTLTDLQKAQMLEYAKIVDGIVYQPGTWSDNTGNQPPEKKEVPDASYLPHIRILLKDKVYTTFYILLTGFTYKGVFDSVADYTTQGTQPENGDFLGPASWAWTNKIVFTAPSNLSSDTTTEVVDLANLYLYNTKYLWFYKLGAGGGAPTQADLQDVDTLNGIQVISGYVSAQFMKKYCVDYNDAIAVCSVIEDGLQKQRKYLNQIPQADRSNYVYFYQKDTSTITGTGQQGSFWIVEKDTGRIVMTIASAEGSATPTMNAAHGFNFTTSNVTVDSNTLYPTDTSIMGTFWGASAGSSPELGSFKDSNDDYVFQDHPLQMYAITEYILFGQPDAAVPLPPQPVTDGDIDYGFDFVRWLSETPITEVINSDSTKATSILDAMGVHSSYRTISAQSFLQYAAMGRDLTQPIDAEFVGSDIDRYMYVFTADTLELIKNQTVFPTGGYTADIKLSATVSRKDYFRPAKFTAYAVSDNTDVTSQIVSESYHIWGSDTKVGSSETISISFIDGDGGLLPMRGTAGNITGDRINWDMLMSALNQNKSIDILSDKISTNYVQLGNGLRLYISSTEPTDTDVPEGSVGLGWNGVKIYTSGAWT